MTNEGLVARIQAHENEADHMLELWQQNKGLITSVAKCYTYAAELEDLEQEGYFGLCQAVNNYDPGKGVLFSTYATFWIRACIIRYIERCGNTVRVPSKVANDTWRYKRVVSEFELAHGYKPTDNEIKALLGVTWKELQTIKNNVEFGRIASLDSHLSSENDLMLVDTIASGQNLEQECIEKLERKQASEEIWMLVDKLPAKQKEAVKMRYIDCLSVPDIARITGTAQNRATKTLASALKKLRHGKEGATLKRFYDVFFPTVSVKYKGAGAFNRDWTSIVEQECMRDLERLERARYGY